MTGIKSFGTYVPAYRIRRETLSRAWGKGSGKGEKAVCNFDEDAVTMAVEASLACLENFKHLSPEKPSPSALYFSSTSSPYAEKQTAPLLAEVLELPEESSVYDVSGSFACGTQVFKLALNFVKSAKKDALVIASEQPSAGPDTEMEKNAGDGACALLMGEGEDVLFAVEDLLSVQGDVMDVWQKHNDKYLQEGDSAFTDKYGFAKIAKDAMQKFLAQNKLKTEDVAKFVFPAPSFKEYQNVAKALKLRETQFIPDGLFFATGFTGCASPFLSLSQVIQEANKDDKIILCGYGSGSVDVFLLRAKKKITENIYGVQDALKRRRDLDSYEKYMKFKSLVEEEPLAPFSSQAMHRREKRQNLQLYGIKCNGCGQVFYPKKRVCSHCGAKDNFAEKKLPRHGKLYTFTKDILFPTPDPPNITGAADMDGGGRFYGQLTDVEPDDVKIGMPVRLVFRRFHEGGGFYNYFWKLAPQEQGAACRGQRAGDG